MQLTKRTLNEVAELQGYLEANDWAFDVGLLASLTAPAQQQEFERVEREQGFQAALQWLHARYD